MIISKHSPFKKCPIDDFSENEKADMQKSTRKIWCLVICVYIMKLWWQGYNKL